MIDLFEEQHEVMKKWLFALCGMLSMIDLTVSGGIKCSKSKCFIPDEVDYNDDVRLPVYNIDSMDDLHEILHKADDTKSITRNPELIPVNELSTIAMGLNIEGGFPALDIADTKVPWANIVLPNASHLDPSIAR